MRLSGTRDELWRQLVTPEMAVDLASTQLIRCKMFPYQYALVYALAKRYDGGQILEIGSHMCRGTLVMSLAAPNAKIVTLDPRSCEKSLEAIAGRKNVIALKMYSFRYLKESRTAWDMVLVDGNHTRVNQDLPWFDRLKVGGLILFHDYTPEEAARSRCPPVYIAVNNMAKYLGRAPDVCVIDHERVGMAGFYRREGESLMSAAAQIVLTHGDILNLGAGNKLIEGAVNHDQVKHRPGIDVVWNLNDLPWPWKDGSFDFVVAKAVLEHLRITLFQSMDECWRVLRSGGKVYLKIPYWRHDNSFADPSHYWQFSLETPQFFDPETAIGGAYRFYPHRKWRIIKGPRLNNAKSSIHCTLQKRSES